MQRDCTTQAIPRQPLLLQPDREATDLCGTGRADGAESRGSTRLGIYAVQRRFRGASRLQHRKRQAVVAAGDVEPGSRAEGERGIQPADRRQDAVVRRILQLQRASRGVDRQQSGGRSQGEALRVRSRDAALMRRFWRASLTTRRRSATGLKSTPKFVPVSAANGSVASAASAASVATCVAAPVAMSMV